MYNGKRIYTGECIMENVYWWMYNGECILVTVL